MDGEKEGNKMASVIELLQRLRGEESQKKPVEFLVVGLGNPGPKYENTRHNAGFCALDLLAVEENCTCDRMKFHAKVGRGTIEGVGCLLLKPQTFMNESGKAVEEARAFYHLKPSQILVFSDDISLPVGKIRIRRKGSHGGHNGLRDITEAIGSEDFLRIKIGVGKKPRPDYDLAKWVLGKFTDADKKGMESAYQDTVAATRLLLKGNIDQAMNHYN